jgi:hypothetical protein
MSRILRRPMFRGGSTNEGIMSVPRKGYQGAGFVNEEEVAADEALMRTGSITKSPGITGLDSIPTSTPKQIEVPQQTQNTYKMFGKNIEKGSYDDEAVKLYLGKKADASSKFLINFGLKYMSAKPRRGKFGFITTASDAAQKPTEELFADIDKERELKLKLMSILGKSETKGAFEKKVNFIWETEKTKIERGLTPTFKTKEDVVDYIRKQESETKSQSVEDQVNNEAKKRIESNQAPNFKVAKNMAYFDLFGMEKIPKEEANALANRYFLPPNALTPKPNSTDFTLTDVKNLESTLGKLKEGQTYVDPFRRQVFLYAGPNTFRPLSKF